uniref:Uncharacterized protein n=1 Tax=Setaria viridis TaxID=4556 RepID=A0A4U6TDA9_SETVI|nr:hypothetical protein SEVIR_8G086550v2 [Setaria viridis]
MLTLQVLKPCCMSIYTRISSIHESLIFFPIVNLSVIQPISFASMKVVQFSCVASALSVGN